MNIFLLSIFISLFIYRTVDFTGYEVFGELVTSKSPSTSESPHKTTLLMCRFIPLEDFYDS